MQNSLLQYGLQTMGGQLLNQGSATLQPHILSLAYILNVVPTRIETGKSNFSETTKPCLCVAILLQTHKLDLYHKGCLVCFKKSLFKFCIQLLSMGRVPSCHFCHFALSFRTWSHGAWVESMICMHGPPFWGRIKFIQTAPRMALERLNMHRKKVKNAVWLGVRGSHLVQIRFGGEHQWVGAEH